MGEEEKVNLLDYLKGFLEIREIMGTESKELHLDANAPDINAPDDRRIT